MKMMKGMSSSDMNDEGGSSESSSDEKSPKTRVKKVTVKETFARGGRVQTQGCKPVQLSGRTNAGTF